MKKILIALYIALCIGCTTLLHDVQNSNEPPVLNSIVFNSSQNEFNAIQHFNMVIYTNHYHILLFTHSYATNTLPFFTVTKNPTYSIGSQLNTGYYRYVGCIETPSQCTNHVQTSTIRVFNQIHYNVRSQLK